MSKKIEIAIKDGTITDKIAKLEAHKREIEEKIKECQEALERSKKPKLAIPFVPEEKEKYWYYSYSGEILDTSNKNYDVDVNQIKTGNSFRIEEEAKLAYEKRVAETELLMMCDGLDLKGEMSFVPYLDEEEWCIDFWKEFKTCPYRFATKESCQAAIDKLGDRKLRLVFNIPLED